MAQVLLYNIADREKLVKIKLTLLRLGVACREVAPEEFAHPLGWLLGREGYAPSAVAPETFTDEMLVMEGLQGPTFSAFLDGLRTAAAQVALKAVATEHNVDWSSAQLHRALLAEHQAMSRLKPRHPAKKRR